MDALGESLHNRGSQLEELAGRLKEFEEGRQAVERRLEAAKHQIEVQEALGPQVLKKHCSYSHFISISLQQGKQSKVITTAHSICCHIQ